MDEEGAAIDCTHNTLKGGNLLCEEDRLKPELGGNAGPLTVVYVDTSADAPGACGACRVSPEQQRSETAV